MMRSTRGRVQRRAALAALGFIAGCIALSLLVAWVGATLDRFLPTAHRGSTVTAEEVWRVTMVKGAIATQVESRSASHGGYFTGFTGPDPETFVPEWAIDKLRTAGPQHHRLVLGAGWPARAWAYEIEFASSRHASIVGGINLAKLQRTDTLSGPMVAALPIAPIWRGLVINTLAYMGGALSLVTISLIPRSLIRRSRRLAGRCVRCGYGPIQSRCPECGLLPRR